MSILLLTAFACSSAPEAVSSPSQLAASTAQVTPPPPDRIQAKLDELIAAQGGFGGGLIRISEPATGRAWEGASGEAWRGGPAMTVDASGHARVWALAERAKNYGDVTEYLNIPQFYIAYFIAFMTFATALALLARGLAFLFAPHMVYQKPAAVHDAE